eukprot:scaffold1527_cov145-Skeletonema_menzelii.AAC.4
MVRRVQALDLLRFSLVCHIALKDTKVTSSLRKTQSGLPPFELSPKETATKTKRKDYFVGVPKLCGLNTCNPHCHKMNNRTTTLYDESNRCC